MEYNDNANAARTVLEVSSTIPFSSSSPSSSWFPPPPPRPAGFQGPCAACRFLRRRCSESCILSPYFPANEPFRFINAHRVFGASNIVKTLQELPEWKREDAVSGMVYEANARIGDPVYGCAGRIGHLQKQLNDVKAELALAQAELSIMQCQQMQASSSSSTSFNLEYYF